MAPRAGLKVFGDLTDHVSRGGYRQCRSLPGADCDVGSLKRGLDRLAVWVSFVPQMPTDVLELTA